MSLTTILLWSVAVALAALVVGYALGRRRPPPVANARPAEPSPDAAPRRTGNAMPPPASAGTRDGAPAAMPPRANATIETGPRRTGEAVPPPASAGDNPAAPQRVPQRAAPAQPAAPEAVGGPVRSLAGATSWGYQLQNLDLARAAASPYDILVIDYALEGSDDSALQPAELARLQRKPGGGRRIVLAYLSIGEAESYRSYWQASWKRQRPTWLLGENPDWDENYAVCFWEQGWQDLLCGSPDAYLDRIIAAGFDGVYLDKCDVYEDILERHKAVARERGDLAGDMCAFVCRLAGYARAKRPGFLVVMQNAEQLLENRDLRRALDGVAKEELVFGAEASEKRNPIEDIEWSIEHLDLARSDGKAVLVVEYLGNATKIAEAREVCRRQGYVLYVAAKNRELDRLAV